jgi:hypothetical protein
MAELNNKHGESLPPGTVRVALLAGGFLTGSVLCLVAVSSLPELPIFPLTPWPGVVLCIALVAAGVTVAAGRRGWTWVHLLLGAGIGAGVVTMVVLVARIVDGVLHD